MNVYEIILIGIALSIDACAVTIANCTSCKNKLTKKIEWSMPVCFAVFQGVMPLLGYFLGYLLKDYFTSVTKFISAGIFFILALKIIIDVIKDKINDKKVIEVCKLERKNNLSFFVVMIQAVATSIDAFAIGITFVNLTFSVIIAVLIISAITFTLVSLALLFGKKLGKLFGDYAVYLGAIILFGLAIKSLIEALA